MTDDSPKPTVVQLLEFERTHPGTTARKVEAIRQTFGIAAGPYYQALAHAIDTETALQHDAQLTHQIRDRMDGRTRRRAALLRRTK